MRKNLTELIFILDRSGSMAGLEQETIGGFNSLLKKQMEMEGDANVTTVLFDDSYELLHNRVPIAVVAPITEKEYFVCGMTALLDAIGRIILEFANSQNNEDEERKAEEVLFIIITDGMENSSVEYNWNQISAVIEEKRAKSGWEFIFLGANMDAIGEAEKLGIRAECSVQFVNDSAGIELNYEAVSNAVSEFRASKRLPKQWKDTIEQDFKMRGKGDL